MAVNTLRKLRKLLDSTSRGKIFAMNLNEPNIIDIWQDDDAV